MLLSATTRRQVSPLPARMLYPRHRAAAVDDVVVLRRDIIRALWTACRPLRATSRAMTSESRATNATTPRPAFVLCSDWHTLCVSPCRPAPAGRRAGVFSIDTAERRPTTAGRRAKGASYEPISTQETGNGGERSDLQPRASVDRCELHAGAGPAG